MSIKSDRWIRQMAESYGMIEPFEPEQVRYNAQGQKLVCTAPQYGYDVRCANEFKVFTNVHSAIVDPQKLMIAVLLTSLVMNVSFHQIHCFGAHCWVFSHPKRCTDDLFGQIHLCTLWNHCQCHAT